MQIIQDQKELSEALKAKAREKGFDPVGIARVPGSKGIKLRNASLEKWLKDGHQADMEWMNNPKRKNISELLSGVQSVLAVALNYYVDVQPKPGALSIARYAWGIDYHKVIKKRLKSIEHWLKEQRPNCNCKIYVDTGPLLDKAWAEEAGIGWIGKNSNVINKNNGSWFVLGHLLCTEALIPDKPANARCGHCVACIEACPTKAITQPFVVDARKCIAYHTIENRNPVLPKSISKSIGNWVAGCDVCQEVCPWNKKPIPSNNDPDVIPKRWILELTKEKAVSWNDESWNENLQGSALKRIKPWMWRRNASAIREEKPLG